MSLVVRAQGGSIVVPDPVLLQIASRAAESVEGVRVRRRRTIDVEERSVRLGLTARRGEQLVGQAERVQAAVADALETMCGLELTVDVAIEELA